ncbi:MAG: leucine-rich repeat domain-containing protein [Microscillaceae bacterium]|jgi:Leucine-rich repeat (LRR) protein|nr:leucine-rich repeat domain-containing protein [Microscillaceae bacterium]
MIIDLSEQNLSTIPDHLWQQIDCLELYLPDNQLREIPEKLNQLANLKILDLSSNLILNKLPDSLHGLKNLEYLNLGQTDFGEYPSGIFTLPNLKELVFLGNHLPHLPPAIGHLTQLKKLLLEDVQLQSLAPAIAQLTQLHTLSLSYNPKLVNDWAWLEAVGSLKQLKFLYLLTLYIPAKEWSFLKKSLPDTQIYASAINYFEDKDQNS